MQCLCTENLYFLSIPYMHIHPLLLILQKAPQISFPNVFHLLASFAPSVQCLHFFVPSLWPSRFPKDLHVSSHFFKIPCLSHILHCLSTSLPLFIPLFAWTFALALATYQSPSSAVKLKSTCSYSYQTSSPFTHIFAHVTDMVNLPSALVCIPCISPANISISKSHTESSD